MATDLSSLEYPRHLHKGEASLIVDSPAKASLALKDGWTVEYVSADHAKEIAAEAALVAEEAAMAKAAKASK